MKSVNQLVKELKEQEQDFEWYPSTDEMIDCLINHLKRFERTCNIRKALDIGAGDGRVLKKIRQEFDTNSFMIEQASAHIEKYDFGFVVGRDFHNTSLIEKDMDLIFCNPPYSEFEAWACRIIKEANAKFIALILPQRWKNSKLIELALSSRTSLKKEPEIIGSFDFENAERKARAKVDIVLICTTKGDSDETKDIFTEFLENEFGLNFDEVIENSYDKYQKNRQKSQNLENETKAVAKNNVIDFLVDKYNAELAEFVESLKNLKNISPKLLECLDIDKNKLIEGIKEQLKNLKGLYWQALFNQLEAINSRLTSPYRRALSSQVASEAQVEFTKENIHAIVIWLINNANKYIKSSYLDLFDRMARGGNARHYKSNKRFINDEWRYNKEKSENEPHKLDYRIVLSYGADDEDITDMIEVIATNLGYKNDLRLNLWQTKDKFESWRSLSGHTFKSGNKGTIFARHNQKDIILLEYIAYKNKNVHIKFNKDFMGELNLAVGKIRQWLRSKDEARAEFKDLKETSLKKIFESEANLSICTNNEPLCLAYTLPSDEPSKEPSEPSLFDELAG